MKAILRTYRGYSPFVGRAGGKEKSIARHERADYARGITQRDRTFHHANRLIDIVEPIEASGRAIPHGRKRHLISAGGKDSAACLRCGLQDPSAWNRGRLEGMGIGLRLRAVSLVGISSAAIIRMSSHSVYPSAAVNARRIASGCGP